MTGLPCDTSGSATAALAPEGTINGATSAATTAKILAPALRLTNDSDSPGVFG
ncbi:hypothetical protein GCM10023096_78660 [Nonomuraea ferruginea]